MDILKMLLVILAIVAVFVFAPVILILLGCTAVIVKYVAIGLLILLLPVIVGIAIGMVIKRN